MNPSTAYDSDFRELSAQQNSLQVDQQSSYFLARWQTGPLDLSLEIQETNFPLTQGPSALDPASMPPLTRHSSESSPTSSEMSRRHSQDPFPKQVSAAFKVPMPTKKGFATDGRPEARPQTGAKSSGPTGLSGTKGAAPLRT